MPPEANIEAGTREGPRLRLRRSRPRDLPPIVAALAAAAAFAFLSGGYILQRATPIAGALLVGAAVWVWVVRPQRPSRLYLAALAVFAAFTLWTGASIAWSFGPDLTWRAFNVCLLYLAIAAAVGLTPARRLQLRVLALGFVALAAAVGVYAFAGKTMPDIVTHAHRYARLDAPVGYWNVLALLMLMGTIVAVALASRRHSPLVSRAAVAAAAVPMVFAFFFSYSRGGYVALAVVLLVYFSVTTTRLASLLTLVAIVGPAAVVLWGVRGLDTVFTATTDAALRATEGAILLRWSLVALAVTAALQVGLALLHRGVAWPRWSRVAAGAVVLAVVAVVTFGGGWLYVQEQGGSQWLRDQYEAFATDSDERVSANSAARVFSLNTGRPPLWREAVEQYRALPAQGTGAGTFFFTHERFRQTGGVVRHAHSQWLNVLSELGWIGLTLFVAAIALFVVAAFRRLTHDRGDPERPLLAALQAGVLAFVVHISWDWDWDMAVAGSVFFLFAAAAAAFLTTRGNDLADARRASERPHDEPVEAAKVAAVRVAVPAGDAATVESVAAEAAAAESVAAEAAAERAAAEAAAESIAAEAAADSRVVADGDAPAGIGAPSTGAERYPAPDPDPDADGAAAPGRHTRAPYAPLPVRVALSGLALLAAVSWLPPYLGERAAERAVSAAAAGELTLAVREAETARARDPLAVRPLMTLALVQQQLGQGRAALATLDEAAALQPQNPDVHYQRGLVLLNAMGRPQEAADAFVRALELDPLDDITAFQLSVALREVRRAGG
ncbi:MAG: O-antigen ligase family protein [Thermoleophilia bacterium]|nr:O-antigen ligase family protein [Thermoleophilia bacterium]